MPLLHCRPRRVPYPRGGTTSRLKPTPCALARTHQLQLQLQHHWARVLQTASLPRTTTSPFLRSSFSLPPDPFRGRPAMATITQTRSHAGHSHHHHDNTYLVSTNKKDAGVRITRIGLYSNLGMAIAKGLGGYVFSSQAMIADAFHSLTDLASDILTLATVSWSLKPPTVMFPTGFGKVESLGSLGVSGMLLGGGLFMCFNSCELLYAHFLLDAHAAAEVALHAHGHSHAAIAPSMNAAWLAAGTVAIKEWLYQASKKLTSLKIDFLWTSPHINNFFSNESRQRTQVLRLGIQRSSPSSRFTHGNSHSMCYYWSKLFARRSMVGSGRRTSHITLGDKSRMGQYNCGSL